MSRYPGLLWPDYLATPNPRVDFLAKQDLAHSLSKTLDRSIVLGDNDEYGHTGCVNAICWSQNGNLLLTAGDDTTVRLWRMDPYSDTGSEYPFVCRSVINTGHRANIFNVQMLPFSDRIVTAAGDRQVRVFEASQALDIMDGLQTEFSARELEGRVIRCHRHRVKKLVTENSPDLFLSLSEDGTVRQHDLRVKHVCKDDGCAAPLLEMKLSDGDNLELSNISLSKLTPYQFVVAGESPFGYLFDRRHMKQSMEYQWGAVPRLGEGLTTCVRRFGRPPQSEGDQNTNKRRREHISGCRMSDENGHEVLLSYLKDNIYLFSTLDDVVDENMASNRSSTIPNNVKAKRKSPSPSHDEPSTSETKFEHHDSDHSDPSRDREGENSDEDDDDDEDMEDLEEMLEMGGAEIEAQYSRVPIVHPRRKFTGHRSRDTIKDVNFLGPFDEFVVSGSDDGNWFVWEKDTGRLHGIYEGDESVVNVVEGHPYLPLVAVSGIDTTVKLFSPAPGGESATSKMHIAEEVMRSNATHKPVLRIPLASLLLHMERGLGEGEGRPQCPTQ